MTQQQKRSKEEKHHLAIISLLIAILGLALTLAIYVVHFAYSSGVKDTEFSHVRSDVKELQVSSNKIQKKVDATQSDVKNMVNVLKFAYPQYSNLLSRGKDNGKVQYDSIQKTYGSIDEQSVSDRLIIPIRFDGAKYRSQLAFTKSAGYSGR